MTAEQASLATAGAPTMYIWSVRRGTKYHDFTGGRSNEACNIDSIPAPDREAGPTPPEGKQACKRCIK